MHARRSLIIGAAALLCSAALAQVPLGPKLAGLASGSVFSAWNPLDAGSAFTLSNANFTASASGSYIQTVRGTTSKSTGKWYFEVTASSIATSGDLIGIAKSSTPLGSIVGQDAYSYGLYSADGYLYSGGGKQYYLSTFTTSDVIGIAIDLTGNLLYISKNGSWLNSANPSAGTGGISITGGAYFPAASIFATSGTATFILNTGGTAFTATIPTGFSAWR